MEKKIQDNELGTIIVRESQRAKHYTLKITNGTIYAILPVGGDVERLLGFIHENKAKIQKALEKHPRKEILSEASQLQTATFRLHIFRSQQKSFYMKLAENELHISCPEETRFEEESVQKLLKGAIEKALRHEAQRLLPQRLEQLARQFNFSYTAVKINKSRTHWGCCTSKKNINLSLYLMLLPWPLIDYVLLHELCHTIEMSHNERFWQQMDSVTQGKATQLRQELKQYHPL